MKKYILLILIFATTTCKSKLLKNREVIKKEQAENKKPKKMDVLDYIMIVSVFVLCNNLATKKLLQGEKPRPSRKPKPRNKNKNYA